MGARENKVESYLDSEVVALGGKTYKWVSPGCGGVMDRIVIIKGVVHFVEVKTVEGSSSEIQERRKKEICELGAKVFTVYGRREVAEYIQHLKSEIKR